MAEATAGTSNLALRLLTAAVCAPFLLYLLYLAPIWGFPLVAGIVCGLGAWELFVMIAPAHRVLRIWGVLASVAMYSLIGLGATAWLPLGCMIVTAVGMLVVIARPEPMDGAAMRMGWSIAGPFYLGGLFGTLASLFHNPNGGSWVMLSLICGFFSDTGGYFVGRRYGKRPLAPLISPKKTVEGSFGGLAVALVGGVVAHFWFLPELPLLDTIWLTSLATLLGQAGDLCESLIKRSVGVKDSGSLLPGHGGILDRSDAMLFSAAAVWVYVQLFGH